MRELLVELLTVVELKLVLLLDADSVPDEDMV